MHAMPSIQLVIVAGADEDYERELRRQVAEYGLANVTVLGYVNAMAELMEAADSGHLQAGRPHGDRVF